MLACFSTGPRSSAIDLLHRSRLKPGCAGHGSESQPSDIALRRSAKQAAVLAAELRGAFITDTPSCAPRVEILVQHQLPCLLQAQLLLALQRARAREGAEVLPEGGGAHVRAIRQVIYAQRVAEVLFQP